ncbi:MAG: S41 family peptidase, partial [Verrucomicrobiota bacterium]|nr:S41 family peptidase [Verrucomicrobiota bacterium]
LTIATYHTPSGRTPHEVGITPDIPVKITDEDRANLDLFRRRDSLTPEEETALKAWKDPVVVAALETLAK